MRKAFKYRLKTNKQTAADLSRFAGCCRFVWNKALALQKDRLDSHAYCLSYSNLASHLREWKQEESTMFLQEVHSQILQQTLMNLEKALTEAFDKNNPKRFPKFKKKGRHDAFRYPQGFKIGVNQVYLPKIGWIRFFKSREIEGKPKNITVSKQGRHWFISIQTEQEIAAPRHPAESSIGIDMGVVNFATLSNGEKIQPLNSFKKLHKKLAQKQRKLARKDKFSANWRKQKDNVAKLHHKITNARKDYLHKISTKISKNHATIYMEDLRIRNMSKSARGTIDNPGRNIKAKAGLNKTILDQGWYEFRRQLAYKQEWRGGQLICINPKNASRKCPICGHIEASNRQTQEKFACQKCNFQEHADYVAALNILAVGQTVSACGETVRPKHSLRAVSMK